MFRAKIYIRINNNEMHLSSAATSLANANTVLEAAAGFAGGQIEELVDGIGWVVCEEEEDEEAPPWEGEWKMNFPTAGIPLIPSREYDRWLSA